MFHKGLNKEIIINAAKELIEQEGAPAFSMRRLAEKLNVKTASLYAHIESMEALFTEIGLSALREQRDCLLNAIGDQHGDAAVMALAERYRCFAAEHAELYRLILQMPSGNDISGIAWATPFADWIAFAISLVLVVPYLKRLNH